MRFPIFLDIENKPCLVVGSGPVAMRKAGVLEEFGARVVQVSPETCGRRFSDSDIDGMTLVVSATDDPALNRHVAELCREKEIPVNVVDDPANCTYVFPAICRKGPMVLAVSSGGACPAAAALVRDKASRLMPDEFIDAVERLGRDREELKAKYPDLRERKEACLKELEKWND